jgi:hypothetical protein
LLLEQRVAINQKAESPSDFITLSTGIRAVKQHKKMDSDLLRLVKWHSFQFIPECVHKVVTSVISPTFRLTVLKMSLYSFGR